MRARIMWFRRDLRLEDNHALAAALNEPGPVVAAFVLDGERPALAADAWQHLSLASLARDLDSRGGRLVLRTGDPAKALSRLAAECGASHVHCSRDWDPVGMAREADVRRRLAGEGVELVAAEGQLAAPPGSLWTAAGGAYRVFTPFHRAWTTSLALREPLPAPESVPGPESPPWSDPLPATAPLPAADGVPPAPTPDVARWWTPGEPAARARLADFVEHGLAGYAADRDLPAVRGTSELSPRLSFGELSPMQVLWALRDRHDADSAAFVRQLAWREFAYHTLHRFPGMAVRPLDRRFEAFPWADDEAAFGAWMVGRTGYPLVDAGMRQLAETGWMHNRARLVCASFLTKDLLVPWQRGEEYFRSMLVDIDAPLNIFNWQWVAGSGADAAPYFRIVNPSTQMRRFDPDGAYAERWAPDSATVTPIVDHAESRERALAAYASIRMG